MLIKQRSIGTPGRLDGRMVLSVSRRRRSNCFTLTIYNGRSTDEKVSSIGGKGDDVAERFEDGEGFEDKDDVI